MTGTPWTEVLKDRPIPAAAGGGIWTPVLDYVSGGTVLKIEAEGDWSYADEEAARVGPGGDPRSPIPRDRLLNQRAPIGALVGKIGGSTASNGGVHEFVVGGYCVLEVPKDKGGALMLAMNNLTPPVDRHSGEIHVTMARYAPPTAPHPALHVAEPGPATND